jgi:hypothetical protein
MDDLGMSMGAPQDLAVEHTAQLDVAGERQPTRDSEGGVGHGHTAPDGRHDRCSSLPIVARKSPATLGMGVTARLIGREGSA